MGTSDFSTGEYGVERLIHCTGLFRHGKGLTDIVKLMDQLPSGVVHAFAGSTGDEAESIGIVRDYFGLPEKQQIVSIEYSQPVHQIAQMGIKLEKEDAFRKIEAQWPGLDLSRYFKPIMTVNRNDPESMNRLLNYAHTAASKYNIAMTADIKRFFAAPFPWQCPVVPTSSTNIAVYEAKLPLRRMIQYQQGDITTAVLPRQKPSMVLFLNQLLHWEGDKTLHHKIDTLLNNLKQLPKGSKFVVNQENTYLFPESDWSVSQLKGAPFSQVALIKQTPAMTDAQPFSKTA
jgi:hypothetical protein